MKTISNFLLVTLFFVASSCSKTDEGVFEYPVNCSEVNCLEEVENVSGSLQFLSCFGEYGIVTTKMIDGVEYHDAGILENIDAALTEDLPKNVTFSGLYVEKEYPLEFPDPSFNMDRVNQLIIKELTLD